MTTGTIQADTVDAPITIDEMELYVNRATIGSMAKRKAKRQPAPSRSEDRHASGFMIRLPTTYRDMLRKYQEKYAAEHRFRPTMTAIIQLALDRFMREQGISQPPDRQQPSS